MLDPLVYGKLYLVLTIHVGLHKTGTTALQEYLDSAPRWFKKRYGCLGNDCLQGDEGFGVQTGRGRGSSRSLKMLARQETVTISSEMYLGDPWNLYPKAKQYAQAIREHFASHPNFQVVVYLRPQYTWIESLYTQYVAQGYRNSLSPEGFVRRALERRYSRYSFLVDDLIDVFGPNRLIIRAYVPGMDTVSDFLRVVNIPPYANTGMLPRRNTAISPAQVDLLRRVTESPLNDALLWQGRWFFQTIAATDRDRELSLLPEDLQNQLLELTQSDWQSLAIVTAGTRFAEPETFRKIAVETERVTSRPYLSDPANHDVIFRAAAQALSTAIPSVWDQSPLGGGSMRYKLMKLLRS